MSACSTDLGYGGGYDMVNHEGEMVVMDHL